MSNLLSALREFDALRDGDAGGDLVERRVLESIAPSYTEASAIESLGDELETALEKMGIKRLYQHQAVGIEQAMQGRNVVLQAPTASGKTLTFQLPMLKSLQEPGKHALMIYPTKALGLDQRDQLLRLTREILGSGVESWWYDGDTEKEIRPILRKNPPQVLITNPDMLHNSFLGHSEQWKKFYEGLKYVVIDEIHEYRGYFGSNVAMILRRFSYHLASIGVRPQFFLCSATCANAKEHAENLTGLEFVEVNANGELRPRREFLFVMPNIPDHNYWDILQLRTVMAGLACVAEGKSVLAFCPTRKFAETCIQIARRELDRRADAGQPLVEPDAVKVFRSGLSVEERHKIQAGLKSGDVQLAFTTNALEMGIDIGGLDGVILAGFPDSLMSAWQRIGRAGRNWQADAFVLYFARNNPLDRFYATNIDKCLNKPLDDLVVNPENEDIVTKHAASLLYETPNLNDGIAILGPKMKGKLRETIDKGMLPVKSGRWRPHFGLNIRGGGAGMFALKVGNQEIGTISGQHQFREAPQGAIYMHGGQSYRVREVTYTSSSGGEITLESVEPGLRTNIVTFASLSIDDIFAGWQWITNEGTEVKAFYGRVLITESLTSVQNLNDRTGEVLDEWTPQNNSAQFKDAHAFWVQRQQLPQNLSPVVYASAPAINAFQQLLRIGALFSVPLDAHDIFPHAVVSDQTVYIVESYPGGIGIAKKLLEKWRQILPIGMKISLDCECDHGCPNCIVPPRFTDDIDKNGAIEFAQTILDTTCNRADRRFSRSGLWELVE